MNNNNTPTKFEQWCLVELFGHQQIAGFVTEATIGGCAFIRVDVPKPDGDGDLYTRYFGNGAVYAINPTTKEEVLRVVGMLHPKPPTPRVIQRAALNEAREWDDDNDDDDEF
jgi:hypothetical protein